MLIQRKQYNLVKNTFRSIKIAILLKQCDCASFHFVKYFSSLQYLALKAFLKPFNLKLFYCDNFLLPFNYSKRFFLNNILIVYAKQTLIPTLNYLFLIKSMSEKMDVLPLHIYSFNKLLHPGVFDNYKLLLNKVFNDLLSVLLNKSLIVSGFLNLVEKHLIFLL